MGCEPRGASCDGSQSKNTDIPRERAAGRRTAASVAPPFGADIAGGGPCLRRGGVRQVHDARFPKESPGHFCSSCRAPGKRHSLQAPDNLTYDPFDPTGPGAPGPNAIRTSPRLLIPAASSGRRLYPVQSASNGVNGSSPAGNAYCVRALRGHCIRSKYSVSQQGAQYPDACDLIAFALSLDWQALYVIWSF